MKKKFLTFDFATLCEIVELQKDRNLESLDDAVEIYAKSRHGKIKDFGTYDFEKDKMTRTEITTEGIETKEFKFVEEIEKLVKDKKENKK